MRAAPTDSGVASALAMPIAFAYSRNPSQVPQLAIEQLHQRQMGHVAQLSQVVRVERLDEYGRTLAAIAKSLEGPQHGSFLRQSDGGEMGGVLGFRIHADPRVDMAQRVALRCQLQDFIERRHEQSPIEGAVLRP